MSPGCDEDIRTYPDTWLTTLASGTRQPCSWVSLESNGTPGISKGTQQRTEDYRRVTAAQERASSISSTLSPLSPEVPGAPCGSE